MVLLFGHRRQTPRHCAFDGREIKGRQGRLLAQDQLRLGHPSPAGSRLARSSRREGSRSTPHGGLEGVTLGVGVSRTLTSPPASSTASGRRNSRSWISKGRARPISLSAAAASSRYPAPGRRASPCAVRCSARNHCSAADHLASSVVTPLASVESRSKNGCAAEPRLGRLVLAEHAGRGAGRHADIAPHAPVQRDGSTAAPPGARFGEGIQECVGGHVVDLPGGAVTVLVDENTTNMSRSSSFRTSSSTNVP